MIAVRVGAGNRAPPHCVDEPRKRPGRVKTISANRVGQPLRRGNCVSDFEFPYNAKLRPEVAFIQRLKVYNVAKMRDRFICGAAR